jgi:hypothetical protein
MVTLVLLNGAAALAAILVALAAPGPRGTAQLFFAAICAYFIVVHSAVLLTGLAGHLTVGGAAVLLAVAVALAAWRARRAPRQAAVSPAAQASFAAASVFSLLAAVAAGAVWAWPHLFEATRLWIWDDYTYHMIYPALWLRDHAIAAPSPSHAFTMQAWYPLAASAVAAWFMLPFDGARGEALAWVSLTGPLYAAMVATGAAALLGRLGLGCRPGSWALAVVLFLTSERIGIMASSFSDADLAHAAALFAAFAFVIPRDGERPGDATAEAWYAGLLTGIALGIKISAAVPALIILAISALRAAAPAPGERLRAVGRTGLVFAASWVATGGYWYLRNLAVTGNPVYPAAFWIWPGARFPETSLAEYGGRYGIRRAVADAVDVYANWPRFHAVMAVAGLVGLAGWLVWRRARLTRSQAYFGGGALAIVSAMLLLLPATPYSAGNAMTFRAGFVHWDSMRYVALAAILGWVALAFLIDAGAGAGRARAMAGALVAAAALVSARDPLLRSPGLLIGMAVVAAVIARIEHWCRWRAAVRPVALAACAAALIGALVLWRHDGKAGATAAAIYEERFFGGAARVLDGQPPGTRVAVYGDQSVFLTAGARNHLEPVRLDQDGKVATAPIADAMEPGELGVDPPTFVSNLQAARVRLVLVVHLPHPGRSVERPSQERALEASGAARLLSRGEAVAVWALGEALGSDPSGAGDPRRRERLR